MNEKMGIEKRGRIDGMGQKKSIGKEEIENEEEYRIVYVHV
jgi:hypothetical protein